MAELTSPPGLPAFIRGFLNLRGEAVSIVRLDYLLNLPDFEPGLYSHILISRLGASPMGFLTSGVSRIATVAQGALVPIERATGLSNFASVMFEEGKSFVTVLSMDKIFSHMELRIVESHAQRQQAQLSGSQRMAS